VLARRKKPSGLGRLAGCGKREERVGLAGLRVERGEGFRVFHFFKFF
jgi:predicted ThiF/HesA family dinucleotide-utilizing enzyme